jgi:threonine dehydratase
MSGGTIASASVTLSDIQNARRVVNMSGSVVRTPILLHMQDRLGVQDGGVDICLKLESVQRSGSFKMRGLVNQLASVPSSVVDGSRQFVTMSAGNYGRAFAQALNERKLKGVVCMPENAPENRAQLIKVGHIKICM